MCETIYAVAVGLLDPSRIGATPASLLISQVIGFDSAAHHNNHSAIRPFYDRFPYQPEADTWIVELVCLHLEHACAVAPRMYVTVVSVAAVGVWKST